MLSSLQSCITPRSSIVLVDTALSLSETSCMKHADGMRCSGTGTTMERQVGSTTGCPNHVHYSINPNSAKVSDLHDTRYVEDEPAPCVHAGSRVENITFSELLRSLARSADAPTKLCMTR